MCNFAPNKYIYVRNDVNLEHVSVALDNMIYNSNYSELQFPANSLFLVTGGAGFIGS